MRKRPRPACYGKGIKNNEKDEGERDVGRDQPTGTASYGYGSYIREGGTSISIDGRRGQ